MRSLEQPQRLMPLQPKLNKQLKMLPRHLDLVVVVNHPSQQISSQQKMPRAAVVVRATLFRMLSQV